MSQIGAPLVGSYDVRLVVLSILIAISASYAALDLGGRLTAARGWIRSAWLAGGAAAMGLGIWSMHFTGMLAFTLPVPVAYHWPTVVLSLLAAILASAVALYVASRKKKGHIEAFIGSVPMGLGIVGMHYIGMAAMRLSAGCQYSPPLVTLSVLVAILASLGALVFREDFRGTTLAKIISATVMGVAISLMHYIGMASASFYSSVVPMNLAHTVSISSLGTAGIAIVTLIVQGAAMLTSSMDQQLAERASEIETSHRFRQIADILRDVLLLGNKDLSEILFVNRAYETIWGRTVESLYANARSWLEGIHPDDRQQVLEALRRLVDGESLDYVEFRVERPDGSIAWVRLRARPALDSQGHPYRVVGSFHEFTMRKRAEEEARTLIEAIPHQIWSGPPDGTIDYCNERWRSETGLTLADLRDEGWLNIIHPNDRERVLKAWRDSVANGKPYEQEERHRRADGTYRWYLSRGVPLRDAEGAIVRWYGTNTDIEDRKRAEQELRQSEDRIRAILESSPNWIFLKDTEGRYLLVNREVERILRISQEQIKGKTDSEIFPLEQAAEYRANDLKVLRAGLTMEFEEIALLEDGPHTSIVHKFPLFDTYGNIYATGGVATDITERKRAEEVRRYTEEQYRTIVETATDAVISIDEASQILFVNPATAKVFGYDSSELIGRPLIMLMPESLRELHKTGMRRYLDTDRRHMNWQGVELAGLRKNGEEFPVEVSFGEITKQGRRIFTGFVRDITDRKRAEEALRQLSGRLLRSQDDERRRIARDLHDSTGQELVALATMLGQLRGSIPSGDRKPRRLLSECKALAERCIREVRTLSYVLHPPVLDEAGLGEAIRDYVDGFTKRSGIHVELEVPPRIGRLARDIELVLFRVVQESLTNIQRHSGSRLAKIRVHRNADLKVEISDFGRGFSATRQRGKDEPQLAVGVGIPSMEERVKLVGGRLDINSSGHGTSVSVTVPLGGGESEKASHFDR